MRARAPNLWEAWMVWLLFGLAALAVFETYWRLPPAALWKVTNSGLAGGAGRMFVFLSFSAAIAAPPVLAIAADRLDRRVATGLAFVLCASVAIPGVQTPSDLDPKWSQAAAVVGVVTSVVITAWATRRGRVESARTTARGDRVRLGLAAVLVLLSAPYIAAELGFFLDGVPLLGWIFQTGKVAPEPGAGYLHATVHHGHHHGLDGVLLALSVLLLSRLLPTIRRARLRAATGGYLSLMLVYGLTNLANDLWIEQVVKRGWTGWQIPDVLQPSLSTAWAAMILAAAILYVLCFRPRYRDDEPTHVVEAQPA